MFKTFRVACPGERHALVEHERSDTLMQSGCRLWGVGTVAKYTNELPFDPG